MEWTRLETPGRVTALRRGLCAGVTADGQAFVGRLTLPLRRVQVVEDLVLDSFGVVGASLGEQLWFTGRGADGRLHLWGASEEPETPVLAHSLEDTGAMWAVPALDARAALLLTASLRDGAWRLRAFSHVAALEGSGPRGRELVLEGSPDSALCYAFHETGPLVVAGPVSESGGASAAAWVMNDLDLDRSRGPEGDWRRVHFSPVPTAFCSAVTGYAGQHVYLGGHLGGRPVLYEVLRLPFRGLVRSAHVSLPPVELAAEALAGPGRPLVLVEDARGSSPTFVAATARGNRLCWYERSEWKAHPAPDGRLGAASRSDDGSVHVLVDGAIWSLPHPTSG